MIFLKSWKKPAFAIAVMIFAPSTKVTSQALSEREHGSVGRFSASANSRGTTHAVTQMESEKIHAAAQHIFRVLDGIKANSFNDRAQEGKDMIAPADETVGKYLRGRSRLSQTASVSSAKIPASRSLRTAAVNEKVKYVAKIMTKLDDAVKRSKTNTRRPKSEHHTRAKLTMNNIKSGIKYSSKEYDTEKIGETIRKYIGSGGYLSNLQPQTSRYEKTSRSQHEELELSHTIGDQYKYPNRPKNRNTETDRTESGDKTVSLGRHLSIPIP